MELTTPRRVTRWALLRLSYCGRFAVLLLAAILGGFHRNSPLRTLGHLLRPRLCWALVVVTL